MSARADELADLFSWVLQYRALWKPTEHQVKFDKQLAACRGFAGLEQLRRDWSAAFLPVDGGAPREDYQRVAIVEDARAVFEGMKARGLDEPVSTWAPFSDLCRYAPEARVREKLHNVWKMRSPRNPHSKAVLFAQLLLKDSERTIKTALARFGLSHKR